MDIQDKQQDFARYPLRHELVLDGHWPVRDIMAWTLKRCVHGFILA